MTKLVEYDIIIENIYKEWTDNYMNNKNSNTIRWAVPEYSTSQVEKTGKFIASNEDFYLDKQHMDILNNWRAAHAYPLHIISSYIRRKYKNFIVVQRLKRLDSIVNKLKRNPTMNLSKMQDLGGCRVIVNNIEEVYWFVDRYKNSDIGHKFKSENDYIQNPKDSGYRSYHLVYKYHSNKKDTYNKNIFIEIQVRTKLQHVWATAVEMMGMYTKSQLKASQGDKDILRFFVLVSSIFAMTERTKIVPNTPKNLYKIIKELKEIDNKAHILDKLNALSLVSNAIKREDIIHKKNLYYLLVLDFDKTQVSVQPYRPSEIQIAMKTYDKIERLNNPNIDVVLIQAKSFDTLKEAYPNYFADISGFTQAISQIFADTVDLIDM